MSADADVCYTTIYEKHQSLIELVQRFGFELCGTKGEGTPAKERMEKVQNILR